jgi:hypothetical protein
MPDQRRFALETRTLLLDHYAPAPNHSDLVLLTIGGLDDHLHRLQLALFIRNGLLKNVDLERMTGNTPGNLRRRRSPTRLPRLHKLERFRPGRDLRCHVTLETLKTRILPSPTISADCSRRVTPTGDLPLITHSYENFWLAAPSYVSSIVVLLSAEAPDVSPGSDLVRSFVLSVLFS